MSSRRTYLNSSLTTRTTKMTLWRMETGSSISSSAPQKTSGPPALSRSSWPRRSPRTPHPVRMNFLSGCVTLRMS
jgi:hypothetical protein